MSHIIAFNQPGDASVLIWREAPKPMPRADEILIRQTAVGVNFIDIYHRTGLYPLPSYPAIPGIEAVGVVEACGKSSRFSIGDRVAYARSPVGAYTEYRSIPEDYLIKLPDDVDDISAAAILLKGLTAHALLHRIYPVQSKQTILIHAAAGGVGLLLCQWAKHIGAYVIGTVGNESKAELARAHGCDETILYTQEDIVARVKNITNGVGVDVVYDSVGQSTFIQSLDCIKRFGMLVSFGQSSGAIPPFNIQLLQQKGSLYITRPTVMHYLEDRSYYETAAAALFDMLCKGLLTPHIDRVLPLKNAAEAHRLLESRATSGALVLQP